MTAKTVAFEVVEALRDLGVKHVFGVPSGGWVDYMEALRQTDGIEFVLATHEGGAAFMADVCGRLSGAPGVCFGTFGPGATNLSTGIGSALLDRSPMIALTDEMPEPMRHRVTQMGIDHQALMAPVTKATTRLSADNARKIVMDAGRLAMSERPGPVHIGLPVGLSAQAAGPSAEPDTIPAPAQAAAEALAEAAERLAAASKPLLVLGLGAVRAGVAAQAIALAEALQAPIVLNPMAKGMVAEDHPLYAGVLFHALSDVVAETYSQADLVIGVGYDPVEFNYEQWMPAAALLNLDTVAVDIDRAQYPEVTDVVGDIAHSLQALTGAGASPGNWDLDAMRARRSAMFARMSPDSTTFGPCAALDVLREVWPQEGIMTCDVGAHIHLIGQKWPTPAPGKQLMTNGWSAMGFAIPAAIAAKLCRPELPVCSVIGDGGFLMTCGELAVAVRLNLKIVFVVFTDNDLALIRIKQEKKDNPIYGTPIREAGTIGGDNLFGVPVLKAEDPESYRNALQQAVGMDGPVIVEAIIDSREYDGLVLRKNKL
ncbi:thiamine pyrophosphate-binding protein [Parahaliea mediterranea]|uniref:thiamine pyrophosphate-binding protein n=1 Tax=Parahaliea mediterranea TaxID=651086 RepID=UPI000E2E77F6|nr:thiamine pyrophosphate-binding protein [Parahaliea mediterranea]